MEDSALRVIRVLSNNAVVAQGATREHVLAGRGIGFGHRAGDLIDPKTIQSQYVEIDSQHLSVLDWLNTLDKDAVSIMSQALEIANSLLGKLDTASYSLLLDHIAFAVQRVNQGQDNANPLMTQIVQMYREEVEVARLIIAFLNQQLSLAIPDSEAGFIALHLNAARRGEAVKRPLQRANRLASIVEVITAQFSHSDEWLNTVITQDVHQLADRLKTRTPRHNDATHMIRQQFTSEFESARQIISLILEQDDIGSEYSGEAAYFALQIHGWNQELKINTTKKGDLQ